MFGTSAVERPSTAAITSPGCAATPAALRGERADGSEVSPGRMRAITTSPFALREYSAPRNATCPPS